MSTSTAIPAPPPASSEGAAALRVLVADKFESSGVAALKARGFEVIVDAELSPETLAAAVAKHAPKVLVVRWKEADRSRGHAYTIFRYGKKWSYCKDFGSIPLTSGEDEAQWEAWESNWKRGHKGEITEAYYLEK